MARGMIGGLVAGGLVSALGLAVASSMVGPVEMPGAADEVTPAVADPAPAVTPAIEEVAEMPADEAPAPVVPEPVAEEPEPVAVEPEPMAVEPEPEPDAPIVVEGPVILPPQPAGGAELEAQESQPAEVADDPVPLPVEDLAPVMPELVGVPEPDPVMPEPAPVEPAPAAPVQAAELPQIIVEPAPEAVPTAPRIVPDPAPQPVPEASAGIVTGRLPSIGAAPDAAAVPAQIPAIERNAISFEVVEGQPVLSMVLFDDSDGDRTRMTDIGKLPFPISVIVDASQPDAQEAIDFYRGQGAEIVVMLPLPAGATPADIDVSIEAYAPLMRDAVAVIVEEDLQFQALGDGAVQLAVNLAETGHGLLSYPAGLNTGHKSALKQGVHAGLVFRDLDSKGQEPTIIRRFLDNAAFRARNEEGVIVLARTRPETVQALLEWSLGTRAQSVTLAPISGSLNP